MSRKLQPLPEYQSLVRWTVQDVVNWLSQNSMSDCMKSFRHGGVDGNKLVNVTTTDLNTINCPKRHIPDIMKLVGQVIKPGMPPPKRGGGGGWRQPVPKAPPNEQTFRDAFPSSRNAPAQSYNDGSASGSEDDAMWDEDEFDEEESDGDESYESPVENQQPIAPPRPSRGLPAVPQQQQQQQHAQQFESQDSIEEFYEDPDNPKTSSAPILPGRPPVAIPTVDENDGEDYEDPDKTVHVQHFHGGPLPTPPSQNQSKNVPIGRRQPAPIPGSGPTLPARPGGQTLPARPGAPSHTARGPSLPDRPGVRVLPPADDGEDYEEPDNTKRPLPPPLSSVPSFKHKQPAILPDDQEEYEEPDLKPRPPPVSSVPSFKHRQVAVEPEEEYEDPDAPVIQSRPPPLAQRRPLPPPIETMQTPKTNHVPPVPSNVPSRKPPVEPVDQEETYEVVDEADSTKPVSKQPPHPTLPLPAVPQPTAELYEVPDNNNEDNNEEYLEMEKGDTLLNKDSEASDTEDYLDMCEGEILSGGVPRVNSVSPKVASPAMPPRRGAMPLPRERQPAPAPSSRKPVQEFEEQETYEIPDEDNSRDVAKKNPGITNGSFLHGNRLDRPLPPSPNTVNQPKKEPRRTTPRAPAQTPAAPTPAVPAPRTTTTPSVAETTPAHKEFTEADLMRQRWYHGTMTRKEGDELLQQCNQDGMYFIRKSSQGGDKPYTLQIYFEHKTYNLPIRKKDNGQYAMGKDEKPDEKTFVNLLLLVNQFKKSPIILAGGKQTKLVKSLPMT